MDDPLADGGAERVSNSILVCRVGQGGQGGDLIGRDLLRGVGVDLRAIGGADRRVVDRAQPNPCETERRHEQRRLDEERGNHRGIADSTHMAVAKNAPITNP